MSYYENVYKRRINRYGHDYQSRVQGQRERNFEDYLLKSLYRVDCEYDDKTIPATLERYKQDYVGTQCYLLTRITDVIPNGTILMITSQNGAEQPWMVWWLEHIEASGYNKYVVLKMNNYINWKIGETTFSQWGYFSGPGTSAISDTIESSSTAPLYRENQNLYRIIMPYAADLKIEAYAEIKSMETTTPFVVTDIDVHSTPGVIYVTVDPTFDRDESEKPIPTDKDNPEDFFWLNGGK